MDDESTDASHELQALVQHALIYSSSGLIMIIFTNIHTLSSFDLDDVDVARNEA